MSETDEAREVRSDARAVEESPRTLTELIREQAALRRVATLLAGGVPFQEVLSVVCEEVGAVLAADASALAVPADGGVLLVATWGRSEPFPSAGTARPVAHGSVSARVIETGRPARSDAPVELEGELGAMARRMGLQSTVGVPVTVGGKLWGALLVSSRREAAWAEQTEDRLAAFTNLIAMAISNADAVRQLEHVAAEQTALRRVATLVARGASSREVADAVAAEVGKLLDADSTIVARHDSDDSLVTVASWSDTPEWGIPVGTRRPAGGHNAATIVLETGQPTRTDDVAGSTGPIAELGASQGYRAAIAAPITVNGRIWGVMLVVNQQLGRFPPGAETRLAEFTDLVATALANAQVQDELHRHVQEQVALQRVATLVAQATPPAEIFSAVSREVECLFDAAAAAVVKFEHDPAGLSIVGTGDQMRSSAIGSRFELAEGYASTEVYQTGHSARRQAPRGEVLDGPVYEVARTIATGGVLRVGSVVASPLTVAGQLWGAISVSSADTLPDETEVRLERFADIVVTAIANADSRQALAALAAEQAALRRIATQVAQGLRPDQMFAAVVEQIATITGFRAAVARFDPQGPSMVIEGTSVGNDVPVGTRWNLSDAKASAVVYRTGRPARMDSRDWSPDVGPVADVGRRLGIVSQVAVPIVVEGNLWGTMSVLGESRLPDDTGRRMERFTELMATAIANAESKSELAASRRRLVNAGDEARRRIERDLHDGIQQGLVELKLRAHALARKEPDEIRHAAVEFADRLADVSDELREVARGIHPAILSEAGLGPALRALARRSSVPAKVEVRVDHRLPEDVEAAAYYVASEALTNVTKHARASVVELRATLEEGLLWFQVRDDGIGGVDQSRGSGVLGIKDRVEALGGHVWVDSPAGEGTDVSVWLPSPTDGAALLRFEKGDNG